MEKAKVVFFKRISLNEIWYNVLQISTKIWPHGPITIVAALIQIVVIIWISDDSGGIIYWHIDASIRIGALNNFLRDCFNDGYIQGMVPL